jgi:hypothetical protein
MLLDVVASDAVERQAELLQLLATELRSCQTAIARLDVDAVEHQLRIVQGLCRQVSRMQGELQLGIPPCAPARQQPGWAQLETTANEVALLARTIAELLCRSRRSVNVLLNMLATSCPAYLPPGVSSLEAFSAGA